MIGEYWDFIKLSTAAALGDFELQAWVDFMWMRDQDVRAVANADPELLIKLRTEGLVNFMALPICKIARDQVIKLAALKSRQAK